MISDAKTFLVVNTQQGSFGIAGDFNAALRLCKSNEGTRGPRVKHTYNVLAFACPRDEVTVTAAVDLSWETKTPCAVMKFQMVM